MNKSILCIAVLLSVSSVSNSAPASSLPVIGDTSSAALPLEEEHKLGQIWIRVLRAQTKQLSDPLVYSYVEDLLYQLSANSQLPDHRLSLIILDNPTLNAFAVPGGVIGIHAGLFQYAETEAQFASVLAHELSHLSQRHYANSLEQQRRNLPLHLASIIGGIILASVGGGDGAAAAVVSGQAAIAQQRLSFSRQAEREADNVGMQVLSDSGFTPGAMPNMFIQMQKSFRFLGDQAPEFLLTHPVTESRIADSQNRATQLPKTGRTDSLNYQLMRVRANIALSSDTQKSFLHFREAAEKQPSEVNHYAKALAGIRSENRSEAAASIDWLQTHYPDNLNYKILETEYLLAKGNPQAAEQKLNALLALYPNNHPLVILLIDSLRQQQNYPLAAEKIRNHLRHYPEDSQLWYDLAELYGLVDNILGVHQSRAEYFLLLGAARKAQEHLQTALKLHNLSDNERARLNERLKEARQLEKNMNY